ncbi:TOBE domain-containing protein [Streptomyces sp. AJS327]|uniref:TOBE domain-containing protein n=1 Tax=Streptomyces sp. AJS327 TaxID=2545265 RepID=UPI0027E47D56|nr:TOBE domain-containing protein [Streptomyces sp. AJS327]
MNGTEDGGAGPLGLNRIRGTLVDTSYLGVALQHTVRTPAGALLTVHQPHTRRDPRLTPGVPVEVRWDPAHTFALPASRGAGADSPEAE